MAEVLNGLKRTVMCGNLRSEHIGSTQTVMGWVQRRRDLGGLVFMWLRDRSGIVQAVWDGTKNKELFDRIANVRSEYVLAVTGTVIARTPENVNKELATGEIEIEVTDVKVLSEAAVTPFEVNDEVSVNEALRFKYRYLDLRRSKMQNNFIMRSNIASSVRNYLCDNGFLEIETPMLIKSTPEGARDYLVPSRVQPGTFFALPQSPQLFKQLLMVSGFDRYFQIARCFRDEDLRADRQPEFTQIDMEMSFVEENDVIAMTEGLLKKVFKDTLNVDINLPIRRMKYCDAMENYGSDKPDLRFGMELKNISDMVENCSFSVFADAIKNGGSVRAIVAKDCADKFSRKDIDSLAEYIKTYRAKGLVWIIKTAEGYRSSVNKFFTSEEFDAIANRVGAENGDIIFVVADKNNVVFDSLGQLRQEIARRTNLIKENTYELVWVTEFPLFEYSEEENRYVAVHHPFTSPMDEDLDILETNPGAVRAKAYDIVLNGYELGGGSIRIHSSEIQNRMFKMLGFEQSDIDDRFGFLVEAFKYGAPPHGGLALGFDRLVMLLAGADNIKDVIAFPKMQNASCLLTGAPDAVEQKQMDELFIASTVEKE
ncbi:MAG: aspartate--tRNA ligase [Clostridia bacterium]|nr:aspartate--tRNA ligase [Clostridia bacterium]